MRHLAEHIHRRMDELRLSQADMAEDGGPSTTRLRQIDAIAYRNAKPIGFKPATLRRIDARLRWEYGSSEDTLAGGEPRPLPDPDPPEPEPDPGYSFSAPPAFAAAMEEMTGAEITEVEARMVTEGFRVMRELRALRG